MTQEEIAKRKELISILEKTTPILEAVRKKAYINNFWLFVSEVMGYKDLYEPLHKRVCDFVQQTIPTHNPLLLLPRGTFKSSVVTIGYPLWKIAQDINTRGMISNATYPMATSFVGQIEKQLQGNETFREYFGDLSTDAPTWRENMFTVAGVSGGQSKEATVTAYGITSNFVGSHFDWGILDDLVNRENIRGKEGLDKAKQFYKDALDLVDPNSQGRRPMIIIGTTWHHDDLYASLQDPKNPASTEFKTLRLPAYEGEWRKGTLLFPKRLSWRALGKQKNQQGTAHFSAQYMLDPVSMEDAAFKSAFKYYEEEDIKGLPLNKFIALDPAISEAKGADYSAMACIGVDRNNDWYILDLWMDRVNPKALIDQIFFWDKKWQPIKFGVETVAFQKTLQYSIFDESKVRNQFIPFHEIRTSGVSKLDRILSLEPRYQMGTVYHNHYIPFTEDLELQIRGISRDGIKSRNDDLIDAMAHINTFSYPPKTMGDRARSVRNRIKSLYPA